jgi:hypothetical protein
MGHLEITIVEARNLQPHHYYVKAYIMTNGWRDVKIKTKRSPKTTTPSWDQRFFVHVRNPYTSLLNLELYWDPRWGCDHRVDSILIPLNTLMWNIPLDTWFDMGSAQIHLILTAREFGISYMPYPNYPAPYPSYSPAPSNQPMSTGPQVIYINETRNGSNNRNTGDMLMAGGLGLMSGILLGELI